MVMGAVAVLLVAVAKVLLVVVAGSGVAEVEFFKV